MTKHRFGKRDLLTAVLESRLVAHNSTDAETSSLASGDPPQNSAPSGITRCADPNPLADALTDQIVRHLNTICKAATLNFALAVGRYVIDKLYDGDLTRWRARNPAKDHSIRKLARHPDLAMSPDALYRSIATFELCERLGMESWKHVSTTHIKLVLPLPHGEQSRLLNAAEANRWSAQRLDEEIAMRGRTHESPSRGGRKRASLLLRRLRNVRRLAAILDELVNSQDTVEPSPESARAALEVLGEIAKRCSVLESRFERSAASQLNVNYDGSDPP
jgi:hypothetical protein